MTKEYQDLQHLDNEENEHQIRKGEGRPPPCLKLEGVLASLP